MKKVALVFVLLVLFAAVAGAAGPSDDKDFRTGLKAYNSKNYRVAIAYFKEYINKKPDPTAYYLIGYSLYKLGKFSEADEYFRDAYFIDPEFSLEKVGLIKKSSGEVVTQEPALAKKPEPAIEKKEAKPAPAAESKPGQPLKQPEPSLKIPQPASTDVKAGKPGLTAPADQKTKAPEAPAPAAVQKPVTPAQSAPQPTASPTPEQPVPVFPAAPAAPKTQMIPGAGAMIPAAVMSIIAGMMIFIVIIGIVLYVYFSLTLFLIAKKLEIPAPWMAFIPILQTWTWIACAGKSWPWIAGMLLPPILGGLLSILSPMLGGVIMLGYLLFLIFALVYLWMLISENLGRGRLIGALIGIFWMIFPLVSMVLQGILAFSKSESSGGYKPPEERLAE